MKSELTSSCDARLIRVTPGSFIMGSLQDEVGRQYWEGEREVTLEHEYYLGAAPVTQIQYERVMGGSSAGRTFPAHPRTSDDAPADSIRWQSAAEYCAKLTEIDHHGANIELREQDYGGKPLATAVIHCHKKIIRMLVRRGADTTRALHFAQRGLAGDFEDDPRLDREGYREIIDLLRELGVK